MTSPDPAQRPARSVPDDALLVAALQRLWREWAHRRDHAVSAHARETYQAAMSDLEGVMKEFGSRRRAWEALQRGFVAATVEGVLHALRARDEEPHALNLPRGGTA